MPEAAPQAPGTEQVPDDSLGIGDIVVTAQKRAQSLNSVGMSITALDSQSLAQRGVQDVADLAKVTPGFVFAPSPFQTPVFTLRGVGVYESGFATSPAVTVYTDEIPLSYPIMQEGLGLDLERVEVLKGPQGTLFGGNSTGGAINYIAAKPTDGFAAGASVTAARFGEVNLTGFVSGALSDSVNARLSFATEQGGAWQKSVSRPGDENGDREFYQARLLVDWRASDRLGFRLNLNGFYDHSQVLAGQLKYISPSVLNPALPDVVSNYPGNANVPVDFFTGPLTPATTPRALPDKIRLADWAPDWNDNRRSNFFGQAALRSDYELSDDLTLTSLTSYSYTDQDNYIPLSGVGFEFEDYRTVGSVETFNQELRVAGDTPSVNWVVGAAYSYTDAKQNDVFRGPGLLFTLFDFRGLDQIGLLPPSLAQLFHLRDSTFYTYQKVNEYAAFGNLEYQLTDALTAQGGLRYTVNRRKATSCGFDSGPNNDFNRVFEGLQLLLGKPTFTPLPPGNCISLNEDLEPENPIRNTLNQDNLSWRVGLNYKVDGGPLLYMNQSRGYKAGVATVIGSSSTSQLDPIPQERLDSYEVGIKLPIGRTLQINGAAFYYDYRRKQVRGRVKDPIFGNLEQLINVPKSSIFGVEGSVDAQPLQGLTLSAAATYLRSEVKDRFDTVTQAGEAGNLAGSRLPFTPRWSVTGDVGYEWPVLDDYKASVGASAVYHSATNATFETAVLSAPDYAIPSYTTVDLRAGIGPADDRWRLTVFGRNVTNEYYLTGVFNPANSRFVYTGYPASYGATFVVRFR